MENYYQKKFISFLHEHNIHDRFNKAYSHTSESKFMTLEDKVLWLIDGFTPLNVIKGAFLWETSEEGHNFWDKYDKIWNEELKPRLYKDVE
jgi:hypothetical protein